MASSPSCTDVASAVGARTAALQATASWSAHSPASAIATAAIPVCMRPGQAKGTGVQVAHVPFCACSMPDTSPLTSTKLRKFALLVCKNS